MAWMRPAGASLTSWQKGRRKTLSRTLEGLERGEITPIPQNEGRPPMGMIKKSMGEMDFFGHPSSWSVLVRGLNP